MHSLQENFLQQIINDCFSSYSRKQKIREKAFLKLRFDPTNRQEPHKEIARLMKEYLKSDEDFCTSIGTTCQSAARAVIKQYETVMKIDGVDVDSLLNRKPGEGGVWEEIYEWLYKYKFLRWLNQKPNSIWLAWKTEAKKEVAKINFDEAKEDTKGMIGKVRNAKKVYLGRDYHMRIDISEKYSDYYLFLLNRGKSLQREETKYLVYPSSAFAPLLKPIKTVLYLPQLGAEYKAICFDEAGKEEYLGILIKEKPILLAWAKEIEEDILPIWDESRLCELWRIINEQGEYQIFYQSFDVVDN